MPSAHRCSRLPPGRAVVGCLWLLVGLLPLRAEGTGIGYFEAIRAEPGPVVGETYFLRHCVTCEHGVHETVNYSQGTVVPINTKVILVERTSGGMVLRVEATGEKITVRNVEKYSRRPMDVIARNMLTRAPVPIGKFGDGMAAQIASGRPVIGMTKEQVVMTRGYPPGHKTPSLDGDIWKYWASRMLWDTYAFENGILTSGSNLRRGGH